MEINNPILYTTEVPSTELIAGPVVRVLEKVIAQNEKIIEQNAQIVQYLTASQVDLPSFDWTIRYKDCKPEANDE